MTVTVVYCEHYSDPTALKAADYEQGIMEVLWFWENILHCKGLWTLVIMITILMVWSQLRQESHG